MSPRRTRTRTTGAVSFVLGATLLLAACGGGDSDGPQSEPNDAGEDSVATIVAPLSGELGDLSFMDSAARGIEMASEELSQEIRIIEASSNDAPAWDRNLREAARRADVGLIITGGIVVASTLEKVAPEFPDKDFVIFDSPSVGENVTGITYAQNEGAFLAGITAALITSNPDLFPLAEGTMKVGLVGGVDIPVGRDFAAGFEHGVRTIDPSIEVDLRFTGDFVSPQKGFDTATAILRDGADVVYHFAGPTGLGVLEAAATEGRYGLGSDSNQNHLHPGNIPGSVIKAVDNTLFEAIMAYSRGELEGGETRVGNLANDGVGFEFDDSLVPAEIQDQVNTYRQKVIDGEIVVDSAF